MGKGNQTKPNPIDPVATEKSETGQPFEAERRKELRRPFPYIGSTLSGALSIVPVPDDTKLAAYTETVYKNCPYSDKLLTDAPTTLKTAIPAKVGDPSPIKHVIYIIKENRTYDQVFGDMPRGNGDPSLTMFPEKVTPNHHKLAREFVLLDNLYCNGHVSADGHPWSTMAYNTDYIARNWALTYSSRAGVRDDDDNDLEKAPSGYLWDACARAGLTYRSYGEYGHRVSQPDGSFKIDGRVPGLMGHMSPEFGIGPSNLRDTGRAEVFLKEFREYEKTDTLPQFIVMSLGEDHTTGTTPGTFTPEACVASNDLALGRIVEEVSQEQALARDGHLRDRGRRPERPRPRRCPPDRRPCDQPVYQAREPRQHAVQHGQHDPHDGADPRASAPQPVRRRGHADVRLVHRQGRPHAPTPPNRPGST